MFEHKVDNTKQSWKPVWVETEATVLRATSLTVKGQTGCWAGVCMHSGFCASFELACCLCRCFHRADVLTTLLSFLFITIKIKVSVHVFFILKSGKSSTSLSSSLHMSQSQLIVTQTWWLFCLTANTSNIIAIVTKLLNLARQLVTLLCYWKI